MRVRRNIKPRVTTDEHSGFPSVWVWLGIREQSPVSQLFPDARSIGVLVLFGERKTLFDVCII